MHNHQHFVVITTFSEESEMLKVISGILELRLAACVQQLSAHSSYRWDGKIQRESEFVVLIKSTQNRLDELKAYILKNHSYDVPEVIVVPIVDGTSSYLKWLDDETSPLAR